MSTTEIWTLEDDITYLDIKYDTGGFSLACSEQLQRTKVRGLQLEMELKSCLARLYVQQNRAVYLDGAGQLTSSRQSPSHTSYWPMVTSWSYPFSVGGEFSSSSSFSGSLPQTRPFLLFARSPSLSLFLHHTNTLLHLPLLGTSGAHMATLEEAIGGRK